VGVRAGCGFREPDSAMGLAQGVLGAGAGHGVEEEEKQGERDGGGGGEAWGLLGLGGPLVGCGYLCADGWGKRE
jgi:hypothetical protein